MTIVRHDNVVQGSIEWHEMRRGLLTASEMKLIITPTLKVAANDKERAHLYHLMSQRIAGYVEDTFEGYAMLRGREDEVDAKIAYSNNYAHVEDCGFITNDKWGFKIGYSPDGLVSHDGSIEAKSRAHKLQIETILEHAVMQTVPPDFVIQCQTGLLVSEREWLDFISYSAGLPMITIRTYPDPVIQAAIVAAATAFEERIAKRMDEFTNILTSGEVRLLATERRIEREIQF